jgi:hypothetical protein
MLTATLAVAAMALSADAATTPAASSFASVEVKRIWDTAAHNAFTDLVHWKDAWYCTFREGDGHVRGDGKVRIIVSADGGQWESAVLLEESGTDLRDPKLSITPDGRLMALMGGSVYREGELVGMQPRVSFSSDGREWSAPARIMADGDWLWRVTWHKGTAYGISYGIKAGPGESAVKLVRSTDGLQWEVVSDMQADEHGNEGTLRFRDDDTCIALLRRDRADGQAWIGTSRPPYTDWSWKPGGIRIGGPEFLIASDGVMRGAGRIYVKTLEPALVQAFNLAEGPGERTAVFHFTEDAITLDAVLPSGGDTSYPGMVEKDGEIWISYYASHEGKSAIYLARLRPAAGE